MAVKIIIENQLIECLSSDTKPEKLDGWILKEIDTGHFFWRRNGQWEDADIGLGFIKPTKSGTVTTDENGDATVLFHTPFIDENYTITLTCTDMGEEQIAVASVVAKTPNSITIKTRDKNGHALGGVSVSWLATLDYNP